MRRAADAAGGAGSTPGGSQLGTKRDEPTLLSGGSSGCVLGLLSGWTRSNVFSIFAERLMQINALLLQVRVCSNTPPLRLISKLFYWQQK